MGNEQQGENALAVIDDRSMEIGNYGFEMRTLNDAWTFAGIVVRSGLCCKNDTQEQVLVKLQMGAELGISPMQSIQNIAVINGRPSVYGDAVPAICQRALESCREWFTGEKGADTWTAHFAVKRRGREQHEVTFSVADAKRARLWGKPGPWTEYPQRMLMWRAKGFAFRDQFPDLLKGVITQEEARDLPIDVLPSEYVDHGAPEPPQKPEPARYITQEQRKRLISVFCEAGYSDADAKTLLKDLCGIDSTAKILVRDYETICAKISQSIKAANNTLAGKIVGDPREDSELWAAYIAAEDVLDLAGLYELINEKASDRTAVIAALVEMAKGDTDEQ